MARLAFSEFDADWVINNDADEFWFPTGARNLKDVFSSFPENAHCIRFERKNFVPLKFFSPPFYKHMVYAQRRYMNWLGLPLPGKTAHRGSADVIVSQGNHHASIGGSGATLKSSAIDILHFTARTFDRWEASIVHGGRAYENNRTLPKTNGRVRRAVYAEFQKTGSLRDFYQRSFCSRLGLLQAAMAGKVVRDVRLKRFLTD